MTPYRTILVFTGAGSFTAAGSIMEMAAETDDFAAEILRMWVSPAIDATPSDEVLALEVYTNDAAGSGGSTASARTLRGPNDDAVNDGTFRYGAVTDGGSRLTMIEDGFHLKAGWYWEPMPDARPRVTSAGAGGGYVALGVRLDTAPAASIDLRMGMIVGYIG